MTTVIEAQELPNHAEKDDLAHYVLVVPVRILPEEAVPNSDYGSRIRID